MDAVGTPSPLPFICQSPIPELLWMLADNNSQLSLSLENCLWLNRSYLPGRLCTPPLWLIGMEYKRLAPCLWVGLTQWYNLCFRAILWDQPVGSPLALCCIPRSHSLRLRAFPSSDFRAPNLRREEKWYSNRRQNFWWALHVYVFLIMPFSPSIFSSCFSLYFLSSSLSLSFLSSYRVFGTTGQSYLRMLKWFFLWAWIDLVEKIRPAQKWSQQDRFSLKKKKWPQSYALIVVLWAKNMDYEFEDLAHSTFVMFVLQHDSPAGK